MLIQLREDWIVSISEISEVRNKMDDTVVVTFKSGNEAYLLDNHNDRLWSRFLAACVKVESVENTEPLD